jgi:CMP-2-keto-3-deoxyoctulosonic acid synthetase
MHKVISSLLQTYLSLSPHSENVLTSKNAETCSHRKNEKYHSLCESKMMIFNVQNNQRLIFKEKHFITFSPASKANFFQFS